MRSVVVFQSVYVGVRVRRAVAGGLLAAAAACGDGADEPAAWHPEAPRGGEAGAPQAAGSSAAGESGTPGSGGAEAGRGGTGEAGASTLCDDQALRDLEAELAERLDAVAADTRVTTDPHLTLLLAARDGRRFVRSHGDSTPTTSYESASTSKLVAAVVLLDLVDAGVLGLDGKPHDLLSFWSDESSVTLRHLLSFRSGFNQEPLLCINAPRGDFANCVQTIYEDNLASASPPGSEFFYSSTHLQIAGLMAMEATGEPWSEIFSAWKTKTGLFEKALFDLPSSTNPRLAGGMHWTGAEYLEFLEALLHGSVLSDEMRRELFANQRGSATVTSSPVLDASGEDWAYGFGNWLECDAMGVDSYDCGEGHRNSSPGLYGAYPFIDFDHDYVGIVAREGAFASASEGIAVFRSVETLVDAWAAYVCSGT